MHLFVHAKSPCWKRCAAWFSRNRKSRLIRFIYSYERSCTDPREFHLISEAYTRTYLKFFLYDSLLHIWLKEPINFDSHLFSQIGQMSKMQMHSFTNRKLSSKIVSFNGRLIMITLCKRNRVSTIMMSMHCESIYSLTCTTSFFRFII